MSDFFDDIDEIIRNLPEDAFDITLKEEERKEFMKDLKYLLEYPRTTSLSKYHDAGSCWRFITFLVEIIKDHEYV